MKLPLQHRKFLRKKFLQVTSASLAALMLAVTATPLSVMANAEFPTAKVNTTGLAVTDTEVTVGQLHSATGTMASTTRVSGSTTTSRPSRAPPRTQARQSSIPPTNSPRMRT